MLLSIYSYPCKTLYKTHPINALRGSLKNCTRRRSDRLLRRLNARYILAHGTRNREFIGGASD